MPDLSLVNFEADMAAFAKLVDVNQADVVQKITLDVFARIVGNYSLHRHPVDTGRARAGWGLSMTTSIEAPPPGSYGPPPMPDVAQLDGTKVVYILNAVPYIEALEDGHSQQAPNGFVRLAIMEVEAEIQALLAANQ
jgi:hypothetical protein